MPTYVYRCKTCQMTHSHQHGMNENPLVSCPVCHGFSEKIMGDPPRVIKSTPPPAAAEKPQPDAHGCPPTCALHHYHPKP